MTADEAPVILGRISGLFGVRGWVKVFSYTEPREAVLEYEEWLLGRAGHWQATKVAEGQRHGKSVIVRLDGVDDREKAEEFIGVDIGVRRETMPVPDEGHYYWSDIIGLNVVNQDDAKLGTVASMLETGAHDVMVVRGGTERLIPFVMDEFVVSVDLANGQVKVDWEWE